jgi:hypothetical protein
MLKLCLNRIASSSKYDSIQPRLCQCATGHPGRHDEFPFLRDLFKTNPSVANKIRRDSVMTTGAAWKSADAGPNRILRWVMLLSDSQLLKFGINMQQLKPQVIAKLRDKASTYDDCMGVARKLTWLTYQMDNAPNISPETKAYLESFGMQFSTSQTTKCLVCRDRLSFESFSRAQRGKAEIETGHSNPRLHNSDNVGFIHRECNIAQGAKTLDEFYGWIKTILKRVETDV